MPADIASSRRPAALMIAAPRSGAGKTTLTLAVCAAFRQRGIRVRAAKAGPDYIDPAFHAAATGSDCLNLDSWAMPPDLLDGVLTAAAGDADLLILEAAMGLFDGVAGARGGRASDLAARFGLPVVLVLDVTGQAQSAAAVARGFAIHDPAVSIAGVILNRVGSERHRLSVAAALSEIGMPVFGALRRDTEITLPGRHLGLVQAAEMAELSTYLPHMAALAEHALDLDALLAAATPLVRGDAPLRTLAPPGQRVAIARDVAFGFLYPHLLQGWRAAGADITFFSPLADEHPTDDCDACWLPGGYPELHGPTLSAAEGFRSGMTRFAATKPVYGECGGYMVLGHSIEDAAGHHYPMLGLLDHGTSFAKRRLHLGYRQARLLADGVLGRAGTWHRGHEFHYATVTDAGTDASFAQFRDAAGKELGPGGGRRGQVSGSFFHVMAQA